MKLIRKIGLKLAMYDALWSFPLTIIAFLLFGAVLQYLDVAAGAYDVAFFQPLFIAVGVVIIAMNAAVMGLWFALRDVFRFIYGTKLKTGEYFNASKDEWHNLTSWQKFIISFSVLFFYFWAVVIVYLNLV